MNSPLELLKTVIRGLGETESSPAMIGQAFNDALATEPDRDEMIAQIVAYWVEHFRLRAISELMPREQLIRRNEERKADHEIAMARAKENIKKQIVKTVYLNLSLPSGTALRSATGAQCNQAGGFFSEIGKRVKSREIVGSVLTEEEVGRIWATFADKAKRAA